MVSREMRTTKLLDLYMLGATVGQLCPLLAGRHVTNLLGGCSKNMNHKSGNQNLLNTSTQHSSDVASTS